MNDSTESGSDFRVTVVVALAMLLAGLYFRVTELNLAAAGLIGLALISETFTRYFSTVWMKMARFLGTVNSKILLTLIFYLLLTPIAVAFRLIKGTSEKTFNVDRSADSYLVNRNIRFGPDDFENPW